MHLIETIKTAHNIIYIYKDNNKIFAFKPTENAKIEILANQLAALFGIKTPHIEQAEISNQKGILMDYMHDAKLLMHYEKELNPKQLSQLKRIILFDIWAGNKDRHTANIFVKEDLIAFDHEKLFQKGNARNFIKIDTGRKLNKNYIDIVEKLLDKNLTAKNAMKTLGFLETDFITLNIKDIESVIQDNEISAYLTQRIDFDRLKF